MNFSNKIKTYIRREIVLVIACILAIFSSLFSTPKIQYIDFRVLILLFNLMIVIATFKELLVLDFIATSLLLKCRNYKSISITLVLITFFASMIVTNDVALITFVPLTLIIAKKSNISSIKIIVFQTLAANLGSALTPMGNPHNLYIYSFYKMAPIDFMKITFPLVVVSLFLLLLLLRNENKTNLSLKLDEILIKDKRKTIINSILLLLIILSVFSIIDYRIIFGITLIIILLIDKKMFKKVDYSLLITFIAFFIFIGNISSINYIVNLMSNLLSTGTRTYLFSIICSQIISNVPASILLSEFTHHSHELLMGVNVGGLGTLIASLASLISYKIYVRENEKNGIEYLKSFTFYNLLALLILIPLMYIFL